ncbi:MAG: hypothetical protein ABF856_05105 [Acetobacter aceti]
MRPCDREPEKGFMRVMLWGAVLGVALVALSGCARPVRVLCPSLVTYSAADQSTLSAELASAPLPMLHRCMRDYDGMRDQARACEAAK